MPGADRVGRVTPVRTIVDVDKPVTKIKFCGLTNPDDATLAVQAGAWALGMILWPGSPRRCELEVAAEIAAAHRRRVELVGVFVNPTLDEVARAADSRRLHDRAAARRRGARVLRRGRRDGPAAG